MAFWYVPCAGRILFRFINNPYDLTFWVLRLGQLLCNVGFLVLSLFFFTGAHYRLFLFMYVYLITLHGYTIAYKHILFSQLAGGGCLSSLVTALTTFTFYLIRRKLKRLSSISS